MQNVNRDYDPRTGRYKQFDPIGLRGGINGFLYGNGDPLRFIDPQGLMGGSGSGAGAQSSSPVSLPTDPLAYKNGGPINFYTSADRPLPNMQSTDGLTCTVRIGMGLGFTGTYNTVNGLTYLGVGPQAGASVSITGGGVTLVGGQGGHGLVVQASGAFGNGAVGVSGNAALGTSGITATASPGVGTIGASVGVTMGYRQ